MILIVVKFQVLPDRRDEWTTIMDEYCAAVRAEPGSRSFEVFTNDETPDQFVLVEEFESQEAGEAHVKTEHFALGDAPAQGGHRGDPEDRLPGPCPATGGRRWAS